MQGADIIADAKPPSIEPVPRKVIRGITGSRLHSVLLLSLLALQTGSGLALERGSHDHHAATVVEGGVDRQQVLRYLERLRTTSGAPGVSAAIMSGGRLVFSGGVGVSDIESGARQDGTSVHNVGSVSKVHAVVAIMQLVEQGKVNLDADIQTYAPWFPRKQAPITVRQILTHTSGIRHYKDGEFGEGDVLAFQQFDTVEASTKR